MTNFNPGPADTITPNYMMQLGSGVGSLNVITPNSLDTTGINAAYVTANILGGGIVQLPGGVINLTAPLTPLSGVKLRGIAPQLVYNTIPDSGLTTLVGSQGGTILAPTGAFAAISWNTAVLGVPASQTAFSQGALTNISFEDLGFLGGAYGILAGATNNPSCWYSQFKNLYATGCSVIGFSITNYQHCAFDGRYTFGCQWGQFDGIDVSSATLAPGNSTYKDLYNCIPTTNNILSRGITFITQATTGGAGNNNEFKFDRVQSNRFNGLFSTQAATMVNTQSTFTVTDGTKFAVGMPVGFSATQNGFTINKVYFVVSVAGNVLSVANTYGGAAIVATAANAVNIITQGFPCFEMISLSGSTNTNVVIDNIDVEGITGAGLFFQNCNGINVQVSQVPSIAQALQSIVFRGCVNKLIIAPQSVSTDDDQNAVGSASTFMGAKFGTSVGYQSMGLWYDSVSNKSILSWGNPFDSQSAGGLTYDPSTASGILLPKNMGVGELNKFLNAGGAISQLNTNYTNTGAAAAMTLSAITAAMAGAWVGFFNTSAGTQTITTAGELINGVAGRTVATLNAGASVRFATNFNTSNGTWTWVIMGSSGPMTAGVIAAPS